MSANLPKISIIVITYNQSDVIGRALDSILIQKEWVYEIIICDDCSIDTNWDIILLYSQQYPNLIKPYRNDHNLGIFGNFENTWSKPTGDIIFYLAGDDQFCDGIFAEAIKLIVDNEINFKDELFCLYFDFKMIWPDQTSRKYSNEMIIKGFDPLSLKLRVLISNRSTAFSSNILKSFYGVRKDIGIYADGLLDIQLQMFTTHNYYSSFMGSIYYAGIGISKKTAVAEHLKSQLEFYHELEKIKDWSHKDRMYLNYRKERILFLTEPSFRRLIIMIGFYFRAIDFTYGIKGLKIPETCHKIFKRLFIPMLKDNAKN